MLTIFKVYLSTFGVFNKSIEKFLLSIESVNLKKMYLSECFYTVFRKKTIWKNFYKFLNTFSNKNKIFFFLDFIYKLRTGLTLFAYEHAYVYYNRF